MTIPLTDPFKVSEQSAEMQAQQAEIKELKLRLETLERTVGAQKTN